MADIDKTMGEAICSIREQLGLTQQEVADRAGIKQQALARIESAKFGISLALTERVLNAMGTKLMVAPIIIDDDNYKIQESVESPGWWIATDVAHGIVVKWKEREFNTTQKTTILNQMSEEEMMMAPRYMSALAEWVVKNHSDKV